MAISDLFTTAAPTTPTNVATTEVGMPQAFAPQISGLLGSAAQQVFNIDPTSGQITGAKPYQPYSTNPADYVAGFSPMQQQAFQGAANLQLPGQYGQATGIAGLAGLGALGTAERAGGLGEQYFQMATNPYAMQSFMSPYMQNVVDVQQQQAQRQADIQNQAMKANMAKLGAFGGGRYAVQQGMAAADLARQKQAIQAQGLQSAFDQAQKAQQFGAGLGLQGLGTSLQGYGQAGQAAGQLGSLGQQQLAGQTGILGLQSQYGQQQQQQQQNIINQAIQNYQMQQQYPMQQLGQYNQLLQAWAKPVTTQTQYNAPPSILSQLAGAAAAGTGLYKMFNPSTTTIPYVLTPTPASTGTTPTGKAGGMVRQNSNGLATLGLRNALKGKA